MSTSNDESAFDALLMRLYPPNPACRAMLMYKRRVWEWTGPLFLARVTYYHDAADLRIALVPYSGPRF